MQKRLSDGQDVGALDQQILDLGIRVRVWKSVSCPNMTSLESFDHDVNCTICRERMIDFAPECTMALFTQQTLVDSFKVQGSYHIDEAMVTFLSGVTLQTMARFDLLDFSEDFYELIQRQENSNVDRLKYSATCILAAFTVIDDVKTQYYCDADFKVDINGDIEWLTSNRPDPRQVYSIYYKYPPTYRVTKAVHRDRYTQAAPRTKPAHAFQIDGKTFAKLPECWMAQRSYLIDKRDRTGNPQPDNKFYDPNEDV